MLRTSLLLTLLSSALLADASDDLLEGFDEPAPVEKSVDDVMDGFDEPSQEFTKETKVSLLQRYGIEGKFTQSAAYSFHNDAPHDGLSALKSLLFLEYNYDLPKGYKLKINGNAFYDFSYIIKGHDDFSTQDVDALESEVELFDAYVQGSLSDKLDIKLGHQVVVWGKSDSIRVTDVINPLDNRRPGMTDIEDLRLPETMVKLDYYHDNWRISPIMIIEQRFNKNPPFGGDFNPNPLKMPTQKTPHSPTYALNIAGEFSGFDVDFYLADIYAQDELALPFINHSKKMKMFGTALNYVHESWLLKGEFAYKKELRFLQTGDKTFDRIDALVGFEYNGIADTTLSYDFANKHLTESSVLFEQDSYEHALRVTSDFLNATLHGNYLIALYGKQLDEGGFQRAWMKYDIADGIAANIGLVDYIGGSTLFDAIDDNDMFFMDISYGF